MQVLFDEWDLDWTPLGYDGLRMGGNMDFKKEMTIWVMEIGFLDLTMMQTMEQLIP